MVTARTLVLVMLVALSAIAPGIAVGADGEATSQSSIGGTQVDADDVLLAAELREDGTAEWRIEYRIRLDDENSTAAFDSLQQDVEANPENYTRTFSERMATTAAAAQEATGREMAIENVTVSAETKQLPREYGVVTYRFTWIGFAAVDDGQLRTGDALAGMFLDSATTLLLTWPEEYRLQSTDPAPDDQSDNSVSWSGPREFTDTQPSLVLTNRSTSGVPIGVLPLALLGALALAVVLGAAWYRRDGSLSGSIAANGGASASETDADESNGVREDSGESSDGEAGSETAAAETGEADAGSGTAAASGAGASDTDERAVPDELLSNEERVLQLLETRGGRMKQQQVVQTLDWTEAKTSQVVSNLREEGEIETFRIGRENVLTLPGEDEL